MIDVSAIKPLALWDLEWLKRRCACGEAVRLPDERREELCEAKSQEAARRASVLVCGSLQRFQRMGIEEKRHDAHECDAVLVHPRLFVGVAGHDDLAEGVAGMSERERFLFALRRVGDHPCRLDVNSLGKLVHYKVYLMLTFLADVGVRGLHYSHADINGVPSAYQFVVDCVFHEVWWFILPEVHVYVADAGVHGIVFCGVVEVVPSSDIVSLGHGKEIRLLKKLKVFLDGHMVGGNSGCSLDGVGELCRVHKSADIAHGNIEEGFKQSRVSYLVSLLDILEVDGLAQAGEILFFE